MLWCSESSIRCVFVKIENFPRNRRDVFPQGAVGFHHILPGCGCAVFLLPSIFLSVDVLSEAIPPQRTEKTGYCDGKESERGAFSRPSEA